MPGSIEGYVPEVAGSTVIHKDRPVAPAYGIVARCEELGSDETARKIYTFAKHGMAVVLVPQRCYESFIEWIGTEMQDRRIRQKERTIGLNISPWYGPQKVGVHISD